MPRKIEIAGKVYSAIEATQLAREILKTKGIIKSTDKNYDFVLWLLKERKIFKTTKNLVIKVDVGPDGRGNCFYFKYRGVDWESFSFKKALESPSAKIQTKRGETRSKIDYNKAFRSDVYYQIKAFREKQLKLKKNAKLALLDQQDPFSVHTDHIVPLHILISDFLRDRGIKLEDVELGKTIKFNTDLYSLKDDKLRKEWQTYHKKHAKLKLMTMQENLQKAGAYDIPLYRYRKKRDETYD